MTPAQMARDAARLTDRLERDTLKRILALLRLVEADNRALLAGLDLTGTTRGRIYRELRARQAIEQSRALRRLLELSNQHGPVAEAFRQGIVQAYEDGIRTATAAAVNSGLLTAEAAQAALQFGSRVDIEFIEALTRTTITTLERVTQDGARELTDALVRGAVRGGGSRPTARLLREAVNLTRYEAERITRTVFNRANNEARDATYQRMGVKYLQADETNDDRTCQYCAARHGMVYKASDAPKPPYHPHCRGVMLPWNPDTPPELRGDQYYVDTRESLREKLEESGRKTTTATAAAPFERMDGTPPPKPVWAPGRGFL